MVYQMYCLQEGIINTEALHVLSIEPLFFREKKLNCIIIYLLQLVINEEKREVIFVDVLIPSKTRGIQITLG